MRKRSIAILMTVGIVAAVMIGAVTQSSAKNSRDHTRVTNSLPALRHAFSIFGKTTKAHGADATSQPLPSAVTTGLAREEGVESTDAAYVATAHPVWVIPTSNKVCLVSSGIVAPGMASSQCATGEAALAGQLVEISTTPSGTYVIIGLAPNGNKEVTVTEHDGSTRTAPVSDNIYEIVGGSPSSVTLKGASGKETTQPL